MEITNGSLDAKDELMKDSAFVIFITYLAQVIRFMSWPQILILT